jgi:hypothetical protein
MKKAFIALVILFLSNIPSMYYSWYKIFNWVDIVQHFLGGFFVAMFFYYYLYDRLREKEFLKNSIIVVGSTILVGVLWEFAEFVANKTLIEPTYKYFKIRAYFMGNLTDTMGDLLMDITGALSYFVGVTLFKRKQ